MQSLEIILDNQFEELLQNESFVNELRPIITGVINNFISIDKVTLSLSFSQNVDKPFFLLNSKEASYPDLLLSKTWFYSQQQFNSQILSPNHVFKAAAQLNFQHLSLFLQNLSVEVVKYGRRLLANEELIETIKQELNQDLSENIYSIITFLLEQGIAIRDFKLLGASINDCLVQKLSPDEIKEELLDAFSLNYIEVQIPEEYLKNLTITSSDDDKKSFQMMKEGLFYELGVYYPEIKFVIDDKLPKNNFSVKLNHLHFLPEKGLGENELLVNEQASINNSEVITEVINPGNSTRCTIVKKGGDQINGGYTWTAIGFMILAISAILRKHAYFFVTKKDMHKMLDKLSIVYPALTEGVLKLRSPAFITMVLRCLIKEEISIRPLNLVLQSILEFDYVIADGNKNIVFDQRLTTAVKPNQAWLNNPVNTCSYVRNYFKNYISYKYTKGQGNLLVYLIDPEIENILQLDTLSNEQSKKIIEAVKKGIDSDTRDKNILTTNEIRPLLKNILQFELPNANVLAYQELALTTNIEPLGRITF